MSNLWDLYRAYVPDDADLATSSHSLDRFRGFFRGEGGIEGHAEFAKVDGRKLVVISVAAGIAVGVLATIAVVRNQERIKRWWENQVIATAQSAWKTITLRREEVAQSATVEVAVLSRQAHREFSTEIDVALEDSRTRMSSAQAQRYLLAVLLAASFIADALRKLSHARIDGDLPELTNAMKKLTAQPVTDAINQMIEATPSLLDDKTSSALMKIFGGGRVVDGQYVPLRVERVEAALSLPCDRRS